MNLITFDSLPGQFAGKNIDKNCDLFILSAWLFLFVEFSNGFPPIVIKQIR